MHALERQVSVQQRVPPTGQHHHFLVDERLAHQVAGIVVRPQRAQDEIHIPYPQLGCQQVERAFVGHHPNLWVLGREA
ncbi:hypothetical protein D3C75_933820 [compost metagenome]